MQVARSIIALLNEIHGLDPSVLPPLIAHRVPCNLAIADHPTVIVDDPEPDKFNVGLLGILNGLAGQEDVTIAAEYSDEKVLLGFHLRKGKPDPNDGTVGPALEH